MYIHAHNQRLAEAQARSLICHPMHRKVQGLIPDWGATNRYFSLSLSKISKHLLVRI